MEKKLYKANEGKMIDGVCAGIAEYLAIDVTVIRVLWTIFACCGAVGVVAYIICALIMPRKPAGYIDAN